MALFNCYVVPTLLYGSEVFTPKIISQLARKLESPQKLFTAELCKKLGIKYRCYSDRLRITNQPPIFYQCMMKNLLLLFKIDRGLSQLPLQFPWRKSQSERDRQRLIISRSCYDDNGYLLTTAKAWNRMSRSIDLMTSPNMFKSFLKTYDYRQLYERIPLCFY